jgi:hypothetical protein
MTDLFAQLSAYGRQILEDPDWQRDADHTPTSQDFVEPGSLVDRHLDTWDPGAMEPINPTNPVRPAKGRRPARQRLSGSRWAVTSIAAATVAVVVTAALLLPSVTPPPTGDDMPINPSRTIVTTVVVSCLALAACSEKGSQTVTTTSVVPGGSSARAPIDSLPPLFDGSDGAVEPGTYRITLQGSKPFAMTIPAGWWTLDQRWLPNQEVPGNAPATMVLGFNRVGRVYEDACQGIGALPAGSAAEVIASLATQVGTDTTSPKVIEVDGVSVTEIEMSTTLNPGTCPGGSLRGFADPEGFDLLVPNSGVIGTLFAFDLDGKPAAITVAGGSMDNNERSQVTQMIGSLRFK